MLAKIAGWRMLSRLLLTTAALLAVVAAHPGAAQAQVGSDRYSSIVIDAASGNVLSAVNPDELRFPASLTKMMTLYLLFEGLRDRRVTLGQYVPVSAAASSMSPTKLGLLPGSLITVEQCILGLVTKSANDAAAALGELLGGDEERFAQMMTLRARGLGMTRTTFRNASGLPDWNQVTTAADMAVLARHLVTDFPNFYHYFSTPYFVYGGRLVHNHQSLLTSYYGADGLKTGYTDASGFNVVTSALRGDTRLIGVVMGASSSGERNSQMASLLDQGFDRMGVPLPSLVALRPAVRMPALISVAQAQSLDLPPRLSARPRFARHEHPAYYPAEPRRVPQVRATMAPLRVFRPVGPTRTAHGGWYRFPG